MFKKIALSGLAMFAALQLSTIAAAAPLPQIQADSHQVVSTRRVGRTLFEYDLQVTFLNSGAEDVTGVSFMPISNASSTAIVASTLSVASANSGATTNATGIITIRQNRRFPFQLSVIDFRPDGTVQAGPPPPPPPPTTPGMLPGAPGDQAVNNTTDIIGAPTAPANIVNGTLLDRVAIYLETGATVGQVNAILQKFNATIESMSADTDTLLLAVPLQPTVAALDALVAQIKQEGAVFEARPGETPLPRVLPDNDPFDSLSLLAVFGDSGHLLDQRFPFAWNLRDRFIDKNAAGNLTLLVTDSFPNGSHPQIEAFTLLPTNGSNLNLDVDDDHGISVMGAIYAKYGLLPAPISPAQRTTGVVPIAPFHPNLAMNSTGVDRIQLAKLIRNQVPSQGDLFLNYSIGIAKITPSNLFTIASDSLSLKAELLSVQNRLFIFKAAGNGDSNGNPLPANTDGLVSIVAKFANPCTITTAAGTGLNPAELQQCEMQRMALQTKKGASFANVLSNILLVGATQNDTTLAPFSNTGSDVNAIGFNLFLPCSPSARQAAQTPPPNPPPGWAPPPLCPNLAIKGIFGTSFSTPTVAGLAILLRMFNENATLAQITDVITQSASSSSANQIDAARAFLLMDNLAPIGQSTPLLVDQMTPANSFRGALLDVVSEQASSQIDELYTEFDLQKFVDVFSQVGTANPQGPINPSGGIDYSRYDLNGDGFTDTTKAVPFDLNNDNMIGSATLDVNGYTITYDENLVTDVNILCYYSFAQNMYTGTKEFRDIVFAVHKNWCESTAPNAPTITAKLVFSSLSVPTTWVSFGDPRLENIVPLPGGNPKRYFGDLRQSFCNFETGFPPFSRDPKLQNADFFQVDSPNAPRINNLGFNNPGCSNFIALANGQAWINATRALRRASSPFFPIYQETQIRYYSGGGNPPSTQNQQPRSIDYFEVPSLPNNGASVGQDTTFKLDLVYQ